MREEYEEPFPDWMCADPAQPAPAIATGQATEEQAAFLRAANSREYRIIALSGEGGAGKTWAVAQLARGLAPASFIFASPSHQARNVLQKELDKLGIETEVVTVAAMLKKTVDTSRPPEDGVLSSNFVHGDAQPFPPGYLVVVDEVSMVDVLDVVRICKLNQNGLTILCGDEKQLPPVKGEPAWDILARSVAGGVAAKFHLSRNMRAATPDLVDFINEIRRTGQCPVDAPVASVTFFYDRPSYVDCLLRTVQSCGQDAVIALAYRNVTVNDIADKVRASLGYRPSWAEKGEILRVNGPRTMLDWHEEFYKLKAQGMDHDEAYRQASINVRKYTLQTGDTLLVLEASEPREHAVGWVKRTALRQMVRVEVLTGYFEGQQHIIPLAALGDPGDVKSMLAECEDVIYRALEGKYDEQVRAIYNKEWGEECPNKGRLWSQYFYKLRDCFTLTQNSVSLTVHKAQGSGRDHVFLDWADITGPETAQLRYTGVSRAKQHLYIYRGR